MKIDGHIHTPYCPHGTTDTLINYIEKAINQSFTQISFTEHAPLPSNFKDPTPEQDSGMNPDLLSRYFEELIELKTFYKNKINIKIGLEVDYIEGYEQETTDFLNEVGPKLDDAILSVHFLKFQEQYCCVDFSSTEYLRFAQLLGGIQNLYNLYYNTVKKSILADLGPFKPNRIGHPTLVHKFQHAHNSVINDNKQIKEVLKLMKAHHYTLDFNSAGLSKSQCLEPYPPLAYIEFAKEIGLPFIFGSDAHQVDDLHQHYDILMK